MKLSPPASSSDLEVARGIARRLARFPGTAPAISSGLAFAPLTPAAAPEEPAPAPEPLVDEEPPRFEPPAAEPEAMPEPDPEPLQAPEPEAAGLAPEPAAEEPAPEAVPEEPAGEPAFTPEPEPFAAEPEALSHASEPEPAPEREPEPEPYAAPDAEAAEPAAAVVEEPAPEPLAEAVASPDDLVARLTEEPPAIAPDEPFDPGLPADLPPPATDDLVDSLVSDPPTPSPPPTWAEVLGTCRDLAGARGAMLIRPAGDVLASDGDWPADVQVIAGRLMPVLEKAYKTSSAPLSIKLGASVLSAWRVAVEGTTLTVGFVSDAPLSPDVHGLVDEEVRKGRL